MAELTKKADVSGLAGTYDAIVGAVAFPDGVKKVSLASLQACVRNLEAKFSGNCNCFTNTNCCQTCQTTTCQSTYCQSQYCQACQSTICQSCQSQCYNCNCSTDCERHSH